jgi:small GTP-binding protein
LFDPKVGTTLAELEGHTNHVTEVAISFDSRVVASFSWDGTIRLWDAMNYQPLAVIPESTGLRFHCGLSFHPTQPLLAAVVGGLSKIHVWRLDWEALLVETRTNEAVQFTSAKVVIVGDTGVGKTGLSLVLAGQPFEPTESSHAARVFLLNREVDAISREYPQIRETFLWDFAGQPGYRVFHQLHLSNVSVALVLFDARNEVDPFAGVSYWARALDNASRSNTLIKILVSTRVDRGGIEVSKDRLQEFVARFGFAGFFETSAKRGDGIDILLQAVRSAIKWDNLPITTTPPSFHEIRREIIETKRTGRVLESRGDLLKDIETKKLQRRTSDLGAGLDICLERLEAAGLARKLAFGDLVLLQPEMLDSYCAWLAQAARDEPEGLGFISEHRALSGDFKMDFDRPLRDRRSDELIILAATVREVVERGVALLEQTMAGSMLVFPSELCIESPEYGQSADPAFTFVFQGPVRTIYATLAITLLNSFVFEKDALFRNTALFRGPRRQLCGFVVSYADAKDETRGSLAVFFAPLVDGSVKLLFLRFIQQHLQRAAWAGTLEGHRVYIHCGELISPSVIRKRKEQRRDYVVCGVCEERIPVDADLYDGVTQSDPAVEEMVNQARSEKERQERLAVLPISEQCGSFHLFFSYNHEDKIEVQKLAEILRFDWGIIPWVDDEQIHAGQNFVETLERILTMVPVAAVVVGRHPLGKWQRKEYNALLERAVRTGETEQNHQLHLIPVLLPSAPVNLELPLWLRTVIPVDFRRSSLDDRELMQGFVRSILNKTSS